MVKPNFELWLEEACLAVEAREIDLLEAEEAAPRSIPLLVALRAVVRSIAGFFYSVNKNKGSRQEKSWKRFY